MQLLYLLFFVLAWMAGPVAFAQEVPQKAQPIHIEADRMESYENKNEVIFTGRVEAKQGETVIHADQMTVTYLPADQKTGETGGVQSQRIDKVKAKGDVRLTKNEWVATGRTLDFFAKEGKAILTGDAKAWQDNNLVSGNKIILYLDEGKTVVERSQGEGERVKALIYPGSAPKGKAEK
ncbi:MAG: lipopolysaccharide transport periplasmic protein LptA [Deltaproteobacteria bacterium]